MRDTELVLSKSDETGEVSYRKVVNTFIRQTDAIYTVSFTNGTILETTWNHPYRVKKQGHVLEKFSIETTDWVQAKDLHPGDVALGADGRELTISNITIDERVETVYNFEVDEYHTYFVGEVGVWVHNQTYGRQETRILSQMETEFGNMGKALLDKITGKSTKTKIDGINVLAVDEDYWGLSKESRINGVVINAGDVIKRNSDGRLEVVSQSEESLKKEFSNSKGKSIITVSGISNNLFGNVDMHNETLARLTKLGEKPNEATYHVFNETSPIIGGLGDIGNVAVNMVTLTKVQVENSARTVAKLIDSGAVRNGGAIFAHSQGAQIATEGISRSQNVIKANVFLFGGAHNKMPENRLTAGSRIVAFDNRDVVPNVAPTFNERTYNAPMYHSPGDPMATYDSSVKKDKVSFENANTFARPYLSKEDKKSWGSPEFSVTGHTYSGNYSSVLDWYKNRNGKSLVK